MPTEKQIASQLKRELAIRRREVVAHVSDTTMHILHDSSLQGTTLWPKKGFRAPSMVNFDLHDVIEVRPVFIEFTGSVATGTLLFNMFNSDKFGARMSKQQKALQIIMDSAFFNNVLFEFERQGILGSGFTNLFGQMKFKFTYTPSK